MAKRIIFDCDVTKNVKDERSPNEYFKRKMIICLVVGSLISSNLIVASFLCLTFATWFDWLIALRGREEMSLLKALSDYRSIAGLSRFITFSDFLNLLLHPKLFFIFIICSDCLSLSYLLKDIHVMIQFFSLLRGKLFFLEKTYEKKRWGKDWRKRENDF